MFDPLIRHLLRKCHLPPRGEGLGKRNSKGFSLWEKLSSGSETDEGTVGR